MFTIKVLFVLLGSFIAQADPIDDGHFDRVNAGWFHSVKTPCWKVCKGIKHSRAEHEKYVHARFRNKKTYVCKAYSRVGRLAEGQLYGNNFSAKARNKVCMVSLPNGKVERKLKFQCLCVVDRH